MSKNDEQQQETEAGVKPQGRSKLVIALTVGLTIGAATGSFVVGPLVADSSGSEAHGEAAGAHGEGEAGAEAAHGEGEPGAAPAAEYTIQNLVLNPAGSGGSRYLMASVTFGVSDAHGAETLGLRDGAIRDIVVGVLGGRTVEQLADMGNRPKIKEEILTQVGGLVGEHAVMEVYFPQFVIQ
jgi:flagellar protein FliL